MAKRSKRKRQRPRPVPEAPAAPEPIKPLPPGQAGVLSRMQPVMPRVKSKGGIIIAGEEEAPQ